MPNIGLMELLVILLLVLLFFGPKSIPGIGKAIGEGIREFKRHSSGKKDDEEEEVKKDPGEGS